MDNKTKILFAIFLLLMLFLGFFTYEKYFLNKEYLISAKIPCNPLEEVCFISHCDAEANECTGIPEEDTVYYKKIEKPASDYPFCNPNTESCLIENCDVNDSNCVMTFCDVDNPELECSSPEDFSVGDDILEPEESADEEFASPEEVEASVLKE